MASLPFKEVADCEYDVDISGNFDDGSMTVTYNHKDGRVKDDIKVISTTKVINCESISNTITIDVGECRNMRQSPCPITM